MPLYFFDVDDGGGRVLDDQGALFPDQAAGESEAVKLLTDVATELLRVGNDRIAVSLRTNTGAVVFSTWLVLSTERMISAQLGVHTSSAPITSPRKP